MRVLITGVGDAFSKLYFGSSALVQGPEGLVLIDCPDSIHRALHEATTKSGRHIDAGHIHDIILTHLHGDHSNGLESLGFARMILRQSRPDVPLPRIHTNQPASVRLWDKLSPAMDDSWTPGPWRTLADFFDLRILDPQRVCPVAGLSVRCRFTQHPVPTIGLLISDGSRTLGWSGDTTFDPEHIEWLSEADLIVHEANDNPVHTSIASLNKLPDPMRRKMRLIHLEDNFDPSTTDISILREGEVLEV
jgi:ribonuclease BN (tRNA processing enzyme)